MSANILRNLETAMQTYSQRETLQHWTDELVREEKLRAAEPRHVGPSPWAQRLILIALAIVVCSILAMVPV